LEIDVCEDRNRACIDDAERRVPAVNGDVMTSSPWPAARLAMPERRSGNGVCTTGHTNGTECAAVGGPFPLKGLTLRAEDKVAGVSNLDVALRQHCSSQEPAGVSPEMDLHRGFQ
jgi:hypothetical protein